ncbi:hypothetical protein PIB30_028780 [Stylosanthes scabra]|uniref:Ubiquitin-like protease family profile domain-containing protein n=1 Tax=Stylosanthes scabra TaxID=79078 RepID=A0ABU6Z8X1_9FABA|nr:hypothetical protein [Stylosanthes scabra]
MELVTLAELKTFVTGCTMNTIEERREFREAFILLLAKSFLCPTTNNFISPERHLPLVVDVANPSRYNWSLQIFTWIKDSIRDFQRKGVKHLSSCMFLLVVILFQRLEFGPLNRYYGSKPWFDQWTKSMFDQRAASTLRKWLLPVCNRLHWYLYAFNLEKNELLVLDSMHDHPLDELRRSLDRYVEELVNIRRRLVLDIALSNYNTKRASLLQKAYTIPQRRNNPNMGKKKEVKTSFTAPNTK